MGGRRIREEGLWERGFIREGGLSEREAYWKGRLIRERFIKEGELLERKAY